jgi:hypothetical protein
MQMWLLQIQSISCAQSCVFFWAVYIAVYSLSLTGAACCRSDQLHCETKKLLIAKVCAVDFCSYQSNSNQETILPALLCSLALMYTPICNQIQLCQRLCSALLQSEFSRLLRAIRSATAKRRSSSDCTFASKRWNISPSCPTSSQSSSFSGSSSEPSLVRLLRVSLLCIVTLHCASTARNVCFDSSRLLAHWITKIVL